LVARRNLKSRVLFVVSAATEMGFDDGSTFRTGYWAPEFAIPHRALVEAGFAVDVATPGGLVPSPDPQSMGSGEGAEGLRPYLRAVPELRTPMRLEGIAEDRFAELAAVVLPGGYAPMVDLAFSDAMAGVLRSALARGTVIAAICHAPAALLSVLGPEGRWPFQGYRMVSFTNAEEKAWLGEKRLVWRVEDKLREAGAEFVHGGVWDSKVVVDRNLITGQNSPSCGDFTRALLDAISRSARRPGGSDAACSPTSDG